MMASPKRDLTKEFLNMVSRYGANEEVRFHTARCTSLNPYRIQVNGMNTSGVRILKHVEKDLVVGAAVLCIEDRENNVIYALGVL